MEDLLVRARGQKMTENIPEREGSRDLGDLEVRIGNGHIRAALDDHQHLQQRAAV